MTKLETLAVELHDHIWSNMGLSDEWPLQICGDDEVVTTFIRIMNELQDEIMAKGYNHIQYDPNSLGFR